MRKLWGAGALAMALASVAEAGPAIDRIRAEGVIRCAAVSRPGILDASPDGKAGGLALDLCRAIGAALLPPEGRIEVLPYDFAAAFARIGEGKDDVAFLTGAEILDNGLAHQTIPGPAVGFVAIGARVAADSPVASLADLAGRSVCFYQGSNAHLSLEAWMSARRLDFARMPFTEYGEMDDAFAARKCEAEAGETGDLAAARASGGAKGAASRMLDEPLATFPLFAVTPASDPQWASVVAYAMAVLERAEPASGQWQAHGAGRAAPKGSELGLANDWASRIVAAAGTYADIYDRNLGTRSRLALPRGPNAPLEAGGALVAPSRE